MPGSDTGRRGSTSSGSSQHSGTAANHLWRHPQSHKVWEKYFKAEAFSSLPIMQYVLSTTDTELTDYLYKPKDLKKKIDMESLLLRPDLDVLYKNPGRCATFAVKVCKELESKHAGLYQFAFFNLGSHRIARCTKTKVVIDSSSDDGAFALRNDSSYMWWESFEQRWKYEPLEGHMYHQKKRGGPVVGHTQSAHIIYPRLTGLGRSTAERFLGIQHWHLAQTRWLHSRRLNWRLCLGM